jgi:hypothetical protein
VGPKCSQCSIVGKWAPSVASSIPGEWAPSVASEASVASVLDPHIAWFALACCCHFLHLDPTYQYIDPLDPTIDICPLDPTRRLALRETGVTVFDGGTVNLRCVHGPAYPNGAKWGPEVVELEVLFIDHSVAGGAR